jgi:hypothetical protein
MHEFCGYTLRYPDWTCYALIGFGFVFLVPGLWSMITSKSTGEFEAKKDGKRGKLGNVFPLLLTGAGAILVLIGLGGYVALTYAPAGRWLADQVPSVAEDLEPPGSADLHDKPLQQIVEEATAGKYRVRLSEGAGAIKITGTYRNFKCDTDLIYKICRIRTNPIN